MTEGSMESKTKNTFYLIFGAIVYLVAIVAILFGISSFNQNGVEILFALALLPLLAIFVMVWGYGLRFKMPGLELDYYPVEKVMKPPSTVNEEITIEEAENLMESQDTDFLSVLDKNGLFQGIFTKADAHKARLRRKAKGKVKNFMTGRKKVIHAFEREDIKSIMKKIGETKHSRLPVLDKNNRLMGTIDSVDINDLISRLS